MELDTVRGNLVSVSASTEAANQERLAGDVRALREEVGAVAAGMSEAYEGMQPGARAGTSSTPALGGVGLSRRGRPHQPRSRPPRAGT